MQHNTAVYDSRNVCAYAMVINLGEAVKRNTNRRQRPLHSDGGEAVEWRLERGATHRNHHAASAIVVRAVAIPDCDKGLPTSWADDKDCRPMILGSVRRKSSRKGRKV